VHSVRDVHTFFIIHMFFEKEFKHTLYTPVPALVDAVHVDALILHHLINSLLFFAFSKPDDLLVAAIPHCYIEYTVFLYLHYHGFSAGLESRL